MDNCKNALMALVCLSLLFVVAAPRGALAAVCATTAQVDGIYETATIQDALNYAAQNGGTDITVRVVEGIFTEDLTIDVGVATLHFNGGYDCTFTTQNSATSIFGTLTLASGGVIFDGIQLVSTAECAFDRDMDGYTDVGSCSGTANDCNDYDAAVHPGADEVCDGLDNNCNGTIDENALPYDADGDGYYGDGCGYVGSDCVDSDPTIHPGAYDLPFDGIDQDCVGGDLTFDGEICVSCHAGGAGSGRFGGPPYWTEMHVNVSAPDSTCVGCHEPLVTNVLPGHYGRVVQSDGNGAIAGDTIVCRTCHDIQHFSVPAQNDPPIVWPKVVGVNNGVIGKLQDVPSPTCDACHEGRAALHVTDTAHDNRLVTAACDACHTSDPAVISPGSSGNFPNAADVDSLHGSCDRCHNYAGSKLNADTVRQVIVTGRGGTPVECIDCHVDKASGHSNFVHPISVGPNDLSYNAPGYLCSNCHLANNWTQIEGTVHNVPTNGAGSCSTCHNSPRIDVQNTIARGVNPTHCLDCHADKELTEHGMVDHEAAGFVTAGTDFCANCHTDPEIVRGTHKFNCLNCHTTVPQLKAGLPFGGVVAGDPATYNSCIDCHGSAWLNIHQGNPPNHTSLVQVGGTFCGNCHVTPAPPEPLVDPVDPKVHNGCDSCHDASGGLISRAAGKDFISGGTCQTCHGAVWSDIHPQAPQNHATCTTCHNLADGSLLILNP